MFKNNLFVVFLCLNLVSINAQSAAERKIKKVLKDSNISVDEAKKSQ